MPTPESIASQYQTETNLRTRIETHKRYTVGPPLETVVDQALQLEPDEALLDIGTGPGDFPGRLRRAGHTGRLVGLDASTGMISSAIAQHSGVGFVIGDAMHLPFANASFDVLTARHMLYHVPDIHAALLEARRVLRSEGRFLALTNADGYMREFWDAVRTALVGQAAFTDFLEEHLSAKYYHHDLEQHLRAVFPEVKLTLVDQWLEFTDATPVLAYFDSMRDGKSISDADWNTGRVALEQQLRAHVAAGPWQVWKGIAFLEGR